MRTRTIDLTGVTTRDEIILKFVDKAGQQRQSKIILYQLNTYIEMLFDTDIKISKDKKMLTFVGKEVGNE